MGGCVVLIFRDIVWRVAPAADSLSENEVVPLLKISKN
jgi:hypothetical protein